MTSMRSEQGFTLMEILVSMTILSVALMALTGLTFQVARRSYNSSGVAYRTGVVSATAGRLGALPYDSLNNYTGCKNITAQPFPHRRCVTVSQLSTKTRRVTLIVTPTETRFRPDTIVFDRTQAAASNPFSTGS
jgi:prepilin-type N-terminal cleavage/methylation domain-containing protein